LLPSLATDHAGAQPIVIERLVSRGVITRGPIVEEPDSLDLRLRVLPWGGAILSAIPAADRRRRAAALADCLSEHPCRPAQPYRLILARCWADAEEWEKASEQYVMCAAMAVAADERKRAGRLIVDAELAADGIPDAKVHAYWFGRARMVRADRLKAFGEIDEAAVIYRELLALGRRHGDRYLLAESLSDLGDLYRQTRRFEKGIRVLRRARSMWASIGDRERESRATMNLGNMYWISSDLVRAQEHYESALVIQRELGAHQLAATTLSNLGAIHLMRYQYDAAESSFSEAFLEHDRLNVPVEKARTLNNLGGLEFLRGRLEPAEQYFFRAAELNEEAGAQAEAVFNHRNLVEVALERGDLRSVVTRGTAVYGTAIELGDTATAAEVGILLAEGFLRAGDFRRARQYHTEVQDACRTITNTDLDVQSSLLAAAFPFRLGRYEQARQLLDSSCPPQKLLSNRHLRLDVGILRMRVALREGDESTVMELWNTIRTEANAIGAPQKMALAACARLTDAPHRGLPLDIVGLIDAFVSQSDQWYWVGDYQTWKAQEAHQRGAVDEAESLATDAVMRLRRDGNWDALWRALGVLGQICQARADYEPAVSAFDEALRIMQTIGRTIDDDADRAGYLRHPIAQAIEQARERIM
jgi:tetratricopeptide (TPR) repeat protein